MQIVKNRQIILVLQSARLSGTDCQYVIGTGASLGPRELAVLETSKSSVSVSHQVIQAKTQRPGPEKLVFDTGYELEPGERKAVEQRLRGFLSELPAVLAQVTGQSGSNGILQSDMLARWSLELQVLLKDPQRKSSRSMFGRAKKPAAFFPVLGAAMGLFLVSHLVNCAGPSVLKDMLAGVHKGANDRILSWKRPGAADPYTNEALYRDVLCLIADLPATYSLGDLVRGLRSLNGLRLQASPAVADKKTDYSDQELQMMLADEDLRRSFLRLWTTEGKPDFRGHLRNSTFHHQKEYDSLERLLPAQLHEGSAALFRSLVRKTVNLPQNRESTFLDSEYRERVDDALKQLQYELQPANTTESALPAFTLFTALDCKNAFYLEKFFQRIQFDTRKPAKAYSSESPFERLNVLGYENDPLRAVLWSWIEFCQGLDSES